MNESSCCSPSSPAFGVGSDMDFGHSNKCVMIPCFNLHFSDNLDVEHLSYAYFPSVYLLLVRFLLRSSVCFFF